MARAHRIHVSGHVWHLTHRCHDRRFLLKFLEEAPPRAAVGPRQARDRGCRVGATGRPEWTETPSE